MARYRIDASVRAGAAERLAMLDSQLAAETFREIADDSDVDPEVRVEAAQRLAGLYERSAAGAFRSIADDDRLPGPAHRRSPPRLPRPPRAPRLPRPPRPPKMPRMPRCWPDPL